MLSLVLPTTYYTSTLLPTSFRSKQIYTYLYYFVLVQQCALCVTGDAGAFNSFFGSSVLEYGKFFTNVFVEGLLRPDILGERLWGCDTVSVPISQRPGLIFQGENRWARHAPEIGQEIVESNCK